MLRIMGLLIVLVVALAFAAALPTGDVADASGSQLHRTPTVWVLCLIPEGCPRSQPQSTTVPSNRFPKKDLP